MSGEIRFKGRDMTTMSEQELRELRGSQIAMVYQEPMASLNPSMKIAEQLIEVPKFHEGASDQEAYARALEMLGTSGCPIRSGSWRAFRTRSRAASSSAW